MTKLPKIIFDASFIISWCNDIESTIICDILVNSGYKIVIPERVLEEVNSNNDIYKEIKELSKIKPY